MNVEIGITVFVLGRYTPCGKTIVVEAKIDHIEHRQFVAYTVDGPGEWRFSRKNFGRSVFANRAEAEAAQREEGQDGSN